MLTKTSLTTRSNIVSIAELWYCMSASTDSSFPPADHRVHVLRHHAEQVGPADVPARLHEEPPGLPPRPPGASLALLQLHVHARRVRTATRSQTLMRVPHTPRPSNSFSPGSLSPLSLEQLGFNALLQLMIGVPLEMVHGILRISLLYMAGVLAGR